MPYKLQSAHDGNDLAAWRASLPWPAPRSPFSSPPPLPEPSIRALPGRRARRRRSDSTWPSSTSCAPRRAGRRAAPAFRGSIIKNGYLVYSWGNVSERGDWASAIKPVMSTMLFYAIKEGARLGRQRPHLPVRLADDHTRPVDTGTIWPTGDLRLALPENPGARWGYNDNAIRLYCRTLFTQAVIRSACSGRPWTGGGQHGSPRCSFRTAG